MEAFPDTCIDRYPDADEVVRAAERAIAENAGNAPQGVEGLSEQELALETGKLWQNGRTLRVTFLDGDPGVRDRVAATARQWSEFANIGFDFGDHRDAEIRVSFAGVASWSHVGTDALIVDPNQATMNLAIGPDSGENAIRRAVLHEFGHALGCIHEHQSPAGGIPWDEEKLYAYYEGDPNFWTRDQTWRNLIQKYDASQIQSSAFDAESIMLYPVPQHLTVGDFEIGWNTRLSAGDKAMIARIYPRDG